MGSLLSQSGPGVLVSGYAGVAQVGVVGSLLSQLAQACGRSGLALIVGSLLTQLACGPSGLAGLFPVYTWQLLIE